MAKPASRGHQATREGKTIDVETGDSKTSNSKVSPLIGMNTLIHSKIISKRSRH